MKIAKVLFLMTVLSSLSIYSLAQSSTVSVKGQVLYPDNVPTCLIENTTDGTVTIENLTVEMVWEDNHDYSRSIEYFIKELAISEGQEYRINGPQIINYDITTVRCYLR